MRLLTKTKQLEEQLVKQIQRNRWALGDRLPSEDQLLSEFGVSRSTIREALNTLAAQGTIVRRHGVGTFVSRVPETGDIVVFSWLHALTSGTGNFFHDLIVRVKSRIEEAGYNAVLSVGHGDTRDEIAQSVQRFLDRPSAQETAGVISLLPVQNVETIVQRAGIPMVMVSSMVPFARYAVHTNHMSMLKKGAELLKSHGYDDFALMYIEPMPGPFAQRYIDEVRHCVAALVDQYNCSLIPVPETDSSCAAAAYQIFMDRWARSDRPKAMFIADDYTMEVASQAIRELGIKIPEELAIVYGTSNQKVINFPVSLAQVQIDADDVAAKAWEMLNNMLTGKDIDDPIVLIDSTIKEGASLG